VTVGDKKMLVATVATEHGQRMLHFLAARLRNAADLPDIVQAVYLRRGCQKFRVKRAE
jgi:DNA-directed RNA polymerase specialized sigma24 family protein